MKLILCSAFTRMLAYDVVYTIHKIERKYHKVQSPVKGYLTTEYSSVFIPVILLTIIVTLDVWGYEQYS